MFLILSLIKAVLQERIAGAMGRGPQGGRWNFVRSRG